MAEQVQLAEHNEVNVGGFALEKIEVAAYLPSLHANNSKVKKAFPESQGNQWTAWLTNNIFYLHANFIFPVNNR